MDPVGDTNDKTEMKQSRPHFFKANLILLLYVHSDRFGNLHFLWSECYRSIIFFVATIKIEYTKLDNYGDRKSTLILY